MRRFILYTEKQRASLLMIFERPNIRFDELGQSLDSDSLKDRFTKINKDQNEITKPIL